MGHNYLPDNQEHFVRPYWEADLNKNHQKQLDEYKRIPIVAPALSSR